jgi:acyl carrier protein
MDDLRERLTRCFSAVFPDLGHDEIPHASAASVGAWDSLATITLVTVLEEEFGLPLPPEDVEQLSSFELVLDYLEAKQAHVS